MGDPWKECRLWWESDSANYMKQPQRRWGERAGLNVFGNECKIKGKINCTYTLYSSHEVVSHRGMCERFWHCCGCIQEQNNEVNCWQVSHHWSGNLQQEEEDTTIYEVMDRSWRHQNDIRFRSICIQMVRCRSILYICLCMG